ncbi:class F sortase [Planococcus sp. APC 4015]|nr:class F sortase [Planococcus sp. APC 4015]
MRRTIVAALAAAAIVLGTAGCGASPAAVTPPVPTESSPPPVPPTPAVDVPVTAATPAPARQPVPPVRVVAASIGVDMPVVPVGVEPEGFMELVEDPAIAGWYRFGSDSAASEGNVVISAHVDSPDYPIGPLSRLRDLSAGAEIEVTDAAGTAHRYAVASVTYYPKTELPVDALFARSGGRALVLITCGGEYDPAVGRYTDNVVAIATPVS